VRLTSEQVLALAPDASSAAAGKKQANPRVWRNLGQNEHAAWGECQGSAVYQVRVELETFTVKCTCPSHKFPCKHGLGLLLLAADGKTVPAAEPPEWVASWLAKRAATESAKREKVAESAKAADDAPTKEQLKRIEKRENLVAHGLDALDLWLSDLMRNGLAGLEGQPVTFWERQAAQMVDSQAQGIAGRIRSMAEIPGSVPDWPAKLLGQLGRLALLSHSYRRGDALDPALREDVRQLTGWTLKEDEVTARGETVTDDWLLLGQHIEDEERGKAQRTWLLGVQSLRPALILQFSFMNQPLKEMLAPGIRQHGDLSFWPGAAPLRAHFSARSADTAPISALPGHESIEVFLGSAAALLARQPWHERFLCSLRNVTPIYDITRDRWHIRDSTGAALPLRSGGHWRLLAISGGAPVDFAGEWDGETLLPLGALAANEYYLLGQGA
jgi:hypothetical protein